MTEHNTARIERLREKAVNPVYNCNAFYLCFYRNYSRNERDIIDYESYSRAYLYASQNVPISLSADELIVGKADIPFSSEQSAEWDSLQPLVQKTAVRLGQDSHMSIDYELLLNKGIKGILADIDALLNNCDDDKKAFYNACKTCLNAVIIHSNRYAKEALKQAEGCSDNIRRAELLKIAEVCANVPENPANSFYEAVQSVHFVTFCLTFDPMRINSQQFQLGHPDRYLLPFYLADIKSGALTEDFAQTLLDCLGILINHRVPSGLSSGYMVGGRNTDGSVVSNELTDMCMQVIDDIRLVYPSVGLCVCKDTPEGHLGKACEILSHGRSHPAVFNDDIITEGLRFYGISEAQAHNYIHSTCVEITPVGCSNVWVASPYTNLPQILLDCLDYEYDTFDGLLSEIFYRLDRSIIRNLKVELANRKERNRRGMNPLLSCFVSDCLSRGLDIERGGAEYNWIMPSFVGLANLVDSLYAVKTVVFEQKRFTVAQMKELCENNFEGNEPLRLELLNSIPKYGNDNDDIDILARIITNHIVNECRSHTDENGGTLLVPSVFCWVMHERFGSDTSATPDGRPAHFPLGDGSGPCQGREHQGPTASVLSATKWSHKELIGGVAVNMKFSKKTFSEDSFKKMTALIKTYLARGGFEMQINVTDKDTLLAAQKDPERYQDLVVRIGGYSDYFVRLSPNMQSEVILRTEHEI